MSFEADSLGNVGYQYTWGTAGVDDIVAVDSGSNHYYAVTDKLGSVRGLVKRDGTWQWGTQYTPYGGVFEHDSVSGATPRLALGWTGARYDLETGFYFLRNREYDPAAGRFTQEDPIGYGGGPNVYAYANGSPLSLRDPTGLDAYCYDVPQSRYGETGDTTYSDPTYCVDDGEVLGGMGGGGFGPNYGPGSGGNGPKHPIVPTCASLGLPCGSSNGPTRSAGTSADSDEAGTGPGLYCLWFILNCKAVSDNFQAARPLNETTPQEVNSGGLDVRADAAEKATAEEGASTWRLIFRGAASGSTEFSFPMILLIPPSEVQILLCNFGPCGRQPQGA